MTDFEKYIRKHNEDVSSKNVYLYLCEKLDNLEVLASSRRNNNLFRILLNHASNDFKIGN